MRVRRSVGGGPPPVSNQKQPFPCEDRPGTSLGLSRGTQLFSHTQSWGGLGCDKGGALAGSEDVKSRVLSPSIPGLLGK